MERSLVWLPQAQKEFKKIPELVKQKIENSLCSIRNGNSISNSKSLDQVSSGVKEVRTKSVNGDFRTYYIQKFKEAVYVIGCSPKVKSSLTTKERESITNRARFVVLNRSI